LRLERTALREIVERHTAKLQACDEAGRKDEDRPEGGVVCQHGRDVAVRNAVFRPDVRTDPNLIKDASPRDEFAVAGVVHHSPGEPADEGRRPAEDRRGGAPPGQVVGELRTSVVLGTLVPNGGAERDVQGAMGVDARNRANARLLLEVLVANRIGGRGRLRRVADPVETRVDRSLVATARVETEFARQEIGSVEPQDVALLNQAHAVVVVLQARRKKEIDIPEVGRGIVIKPRERGGGAELKSDVTVSPDNRKTGQLEASWRGVGRLRRCRRRRQWLRTLRSRPRFVAACGARSGQPQHERDGREDNPPETARETNR
jgi:hypothetical protein